MQQRILSRVKASGHRCFTSLNLKSDATERLWKPEFQVANLGRIPSLVVLYHILNTAVLALNTMLYKQRSVRLFWHLNCDKVKGNSLYLAQTVIDCQCVHIIHLLILLVNFVSFRQSSNFQSVSYLLYANWNNKNTSKKWNSHFHPKVIKQQQHKTTS